MHGGANALEWFVQPGAKFTNPSTWLDYFTNREWVFQVIYANAFRGMNDKTFRILNSEKFKLADPVYLLWWFGRCNYEYNRLTRIRYEREDPRHPLAISEIAGCMDLWDAMVCAIGKNLGLEKQAAFRVRLGQNKEGFRLYSIEGDTTRFQHGFAGGSVTEDRPGTGPDPTMITPDSENPEPDGKPPGKNPQVKNMGGNPKSKTYCGQHLFGLLPRLLQIQPPRDSFHAELGPGGGGMRVPMGPEHRGFNA